jgi:hypothetical protein
VTYYISYLGHFQKLIYRILSKINHIKGPDRL